MLTGRLACLNVLLQHLVRKMEIGLSKRRDLIVMETQYIVCYANLQKSK